MSTAVVEKDSKTRKDPVNTVKQREEELNDRLAAIQEAEASLKQELNQIGSGYAAEVNKENEAYSDVVDKLAEKHRDKLSTFELKRHRKDKEAGKAKARLIGQHLEVIVNTKLYKVRWSAVAELYEYLGYDANSVKRYRYLYRFQNRLTAAGETVQPTLPYVAEPLQRFEDEPEIELKVWQKIVEEHGECPTGPQVKSIVDRQPRTEKEKADKRRREEQSQMARLKKEEEARKAEESRRQQEAPRRTEQDHDPDDDDEEEEADFIETLAKKDREPIECLAAVADELDRIYMAVKDGPTGYFDQGRANEAETRLKHIIETAKDCFGLIAR
jgi:hypothetical protein